MIPDDPLPHGEPSKPVPVEPKQAAHLVGLAARQAAAVAALGRVPASDKELPGVVIWEQGGAALAVGLAELDVAFGDGVIVVALPVWCDQLKDHKDLVQITFAVGAPGRPTGLLAATPRRPQGPQVVLDGWGEQLVALAWQAVLDTAAGVAAQTGTDTLHAIDARVIPDGRWTAGFRRRVRAIRRARGLSDFARVDAQLWNHANVQAGFWADPWAAGGPTEADLVERIVGMATPRPGGATTRARAAASVALPAGHARVEVCVHRRGLAEARAADVAVLLLRRPLPTGTPPDPSPADWAGLPALAVVGLEAAMHNVGAAGGPLPAGVALPADWQVADATTNIRRPTRPARTAESTVPTFEVDFTGQAGTWLLLAVVHHGAGTPDLGAPADLHDLVRRSPHVAARSVLVV